MKKVIFWLLLVPTLAMGQTKNVLNTFRVFAKNDKVVEFEKALANHAQKFHTGDWKWRVWSIDTGPDANGYMITEGPNSWEQIDARNDISALHTADWETNVSPLTTGSSMGITGYYTFQKDLSTVQLTDYADKILINHMTAKPGKINAAKDLITKLKKVWETGNEAVAVYSLTASGEPGYITVTRLKGGFKELAEGFRKSMQERYMAVHGEASFANYLKDYEDAVDKRWSELLIYQPRLSSK